MLLGMCGMTRCTTSAAVAVTGNSTNVKPVPGVCTYTLLVASSMDAAACVHRTTVRRRGKCVGDRLFVFLRGNFSPSSTDGQPHSLGDCHDSETTVGDVSKSAFLYPWTPGRPSSKLLLQIPSLRVSRRRLHTRYQCVYRAARRQHMPRLLLFSRLAARESDSD